MPHKKWRHLKYVPANKNHLKGSSNKSTNNLPPTITKPPVTTSPLLLDKIFYTTY